MKTKTCYSCEAVLPEEAFSPSEWGRQGQRAQCRPCKTIYTRDYHERNRDKIRESGKRYRDGNDELKARKREYNQNHTEHIQNYAQRYKYGITLNEKQALIEKQNGKCACCGRAFDNTKMGRAATDHVKDGEGNTVVRGVLCGHCNFGIGSLGDTLEGVMNAVRYLGGIT